MPKKNTDVGKHASFVEIVTGPQGLVSPGDTLKFLTVALPQNNNPQRRTQVFASIGIRGKAKTLIRLFDGVPGLDPQAEEVAFEYTVQKKDASASKHGNVLVEIGWGDDMQPTWEETKQRNQGTSGTIVGSVPISPADPSQTHDFRVSLVDPLPNTTALDDYIAFEIVTLTQNVSPQDKSFIFIYFKDSKGEIELEQVSAEVPGSRPELHPLLVAKHIPKECPLGMMQIFWVAGREKTSDDFKKNFKQNKYTPQLLGKVNVSSIVPKNEKSGPVPQGVVKMIEDIIEKQKKNAKEYGKKTLQAAADGAMTWGCRRLLARELAKATAHQVALAGGRRAAVVATEVVGVRLISGFALGAKALSSPGALAAIPGEMIGGWVGGEIGEAMGSEEVGKEVGGLIGAVGVGAAVGSVVPVFGTAAGALGGLASWGIGKGIEGLVSLF